MIKKLAHNLLNFTTTACFSNTERSSTIDGAPFTPNGIQKPAEPYVQPEEEVIEQDNDDVGNKSEQADHDQIRNRIIRQNEQRANSLEDLNLQNLFREQTPDNQPIPQQESPARVIFNKTVRI